MKKTALSLLICISIFLTPGLAFAQQKDIDLNVTPGATYLTTQPGETLRHTIKITQNGTIPLKITPQVVDFNPDEHTGVPILGDTTTAHFVSIESGAAQAGTSFPLPPHTTQSITMTITPTAQTVHKEYPLSVIMRAEPQSYQLGGSRSGSTTSALVVSHVIVTVGDKITSPTDIKVTNISTPRILDSLSPLTFSIMAENTGSTANQVQGEVKIFHWLNQEVAKFELAPDIILGHSKRPLRFKPAETDEKTSPDDTTRFIYDAPFLIGPYSIEVVLTAPDQPDIKTSFVQTKTLALPISLLIVVAFSLVIYGLLRYKKFHKYLLARVRKSISVNV